MKRYFIVIIISLIVLACNRNNEIPVYVIPEKEMVDIFVEMHLMDGLLSNNRTRADLVKNDSANYYNLIFEKYGFTRENFDTSIYYYSLNINVYDKIYEQVLNKLTELETKVKEENLEETEREME